MINLDDFIFVWVDGELKKWPREEAEELILLSHGLNLDEKTPI